MPSSRHRPGLALGALAAILLALGAGVPLAENMKLPQPAIVTPGDAPGAPPSDAIVLFDGDDYDHWTQDNGKPVEWLLKDGAMVCKPHAGSIVTKEKFGDIQLHVEFDPPLMPKAKGQDRGNSGVYLQGKYEVQVLDSYENVTYPDGQCGSIYNEHPPLVNANRPPGQWQTYDIVFRAARFDEAGNRTSQAMVTVFHNGVVVQAHSPLGNPKMYKEAPGDGPILLQDHWNDVRYRNIWVRRLAPQE